MKLVLAHARLPVNFNGSWIYLGQNYLLMRNWEKRLPGQRISLGALITEEAEQQRPYILDWIGRQREANGDSLHWWMSHLAGRNNAASQFFVFLIQIASLKRWIAEQSGEQGDVLVLCEDGFLLRAVHDNLRSIVPVRLKIGWRLGWLRDGFFYFIRAGYCLNRQIWWFWRHAHMARKTRPKKLEPIQGEVYLVHQCLDNEPFLMEGPLACRYFTILPAWLEGQGKQVIRLPWLYDVSLSLDHVYRRLRTSNCLIPEDWLSSRDYARALFEGYKSIFAIRHDVKFRNLDIYALVSRERCQQWGDGFTFARFWRYSPTLQRWGRSLSSLVVLDTYEVMAFAHVQVFSWRTRMRVPSKFIGYYNSLVSKDFLAYHTPSGEVASQVFPDVVITNGSLAQALLIEQGLPADRIRVGPALRQLFPAQPNPSVDEANCVGLLLVLSLIPEATIELLDKISRLAPWILARLNVPVVIKPHPMMTKASIMKLMDWETLPEGWHWHDGELYDALAVARSAILLNTAAITDVVISGCIPIPLTRALDTEWNYLDFLVDQYPILRSVPDNLIQSRIEEIFLTRRDYYNIEVLKVRESLLNGLVAPTDANLSVFMHRLPAD